MHVQSLASITNNPKKDSLLKKMGGFVKSKVVGSSEPKFKVLKESQVEDNPMIPKVNPQKDFRDYLKKVSVPSIKTYQANHPLVEPEAASEEQKESQEQQKPKIKEVDPYAAKNEV